MDYNQNYDNYNSPNNTYQQPEPQKKSNGFVIASMVCGIVSLILCCIGLGLPFGALAILFAVLSRRKGQTMEPMAVTGIVTGIAGVIFGLIITLYSMYLISNPYFQRGLYDAFEEAYGEEMADSLCEIYGFDLDEIKSLDLEDIR